MPDAEPAAAALPEPASAAALPPAAAAGPGGQGPIGAHGLSSCIRRMLHKHKVNLGDVLDYTCQAALSLLTRVDVFGVLEKLAKEVKAGWPRNPSALCMQRIKACSAPRQDAAPHPPAPTTGLPTNGPVATSPPPAWPTDNGPAATSPAPAGPTPSGPAASPATSPHRPFAEGVPQGTQLFVTPGPAVRSAHNSPSTLSSAPASPAPVRPSDGPAQGTFTINSPAAGRSAYHSSVYTTTAFNASAAASTIPATPAPARHTADDFAANQPVQPRTVRPVTADSHGLSNFANGNQGSATAAAAPRSFSATTPVKPFTPQQVANLSEAVKQQLYSLVRDHRCFVKASDFDVYIMRKFEAMTASQALHVLQQLDRVSWATVQDPTRYIMFFCCKRAG